MSTRTSLTHEPTMLGAPHRSRLHRRLPKALAALGLAAAVWAPIHAGAQQAPPTPVTGTSVFKAGEVCPFAIEIEFEGKQATRVLPDGTVIDIWPTLTATATNVTTGETVELNVPGPVRLLPTGEAVFTGPQLVIRSELFRDVVNELLYTTGRFTFDPTLENPFSGVGRTSDICAALA